MVSESKRPATLARKLSPDLLSDMYGHWFQLENKAFDSEARMLRSGVDSDHFNDATESSVSTFNKVLFYSFQIQH